MSARWHNPLIHWTYAAQIHTTTIHRLTREPSGAGDLVERPATVFGKIKDYTHGKCDWTVHGTTPLPLPQPRSSLAHCMFDGKSPRKAASGKQHALSSLWTRCIKRRCVTSSLVRHLLQVCPRRSRPVPLHHFREHRHVFAECNTTRLKSRPVKIECL